MIRHGKLRGEKTLYPDGAGCCIWYPFPREDGKEDTEEDASICFDISSDDLADGIELFKRLQEMEPEKVYTEEDTTFKSHAERKLSLLYRLGSFLHDISWKLMAY